MTAPNDVAALVERLTLCANDPMWADHAEVPKPVLTAAAATIAALRAEGERAEEDSARLDWLERNSNAELAYEGWEESVWQVHTVNGGRNDREWTLRAEGQTVREAIDAARSASRKETNP